MPTEIIQPLDGSTGGKLVYKGPVIFTWIASDGQHYPVRPIIGSSGFNLPETGEDLPNFFHVSSLNMISSGENAGRFSLLRLNRRGDEFFRAIKIAYPNIKGLDIEIIAGQPAIYAEVFGQEERIPITNLSGSLNRIVGILLAISAADNGCYNRRDRKRSIL
jgi:hypothetical protein